MLAKHLKHIFLGIFLLSLNLVTIVTAANEKIVFCIDNTTVIPFDKVRSWKKVIETQSNKYNKDIVFVLLDMSVIEQLYRDHASDNYQRIVNKRINNDHQIFSNCETLVLFIQKSEDVNQFIDAMRLTESQTIKQVHLIQLVDKQFSNEKKQFFDNHFWYYRMHIDHDNGYFKSIIKWIITQTTDDIHVTIHMHSNLFTSENDIALIRKRLIHDSPTYINHHPIQKLSCFVETTHKKLSVIRNDFRSKNYFKQTYLLHIEKSKAGPFAHFYFLYADINQFNRFLIHPGRCQYFVPYHNMMGLAGEIMKIIDQLKEYYQIDFYINDRREKKE